jgi:hypothetical protein
MPLVASSPYHFIVGALPVKTKAPASVAVAKLFTPAGST